MKRNILLLTVIAAALIATGCSSTKSDKVQMQAIPEFKNEIPDWYRTENLSTDKDLIVAATDKSKDMQFAIDKAMVNARIELANRLNVEVQSLVTETTSDKSGSVEREIERVSKVITKQTISMYQREKLYIAKEGDNYRAFVLLKMPIDEGRRIINGAIKNKRQDKFEQLDKEVSKQKNEQ